MTTKEDLSTKRRIGSSTLKSSATAIRVMHLVAVGISARLFLSPHFRRMKQAGFDVSLACTDDTDARMCVQNTGITYVPVTIQQSTAPLADFISLIQLCRILRSNRPQVVHAHMSKAGLIGSIAAWWAGVPIRIYHNHGMAFLSARGWKRWFLRAIERITCGFATTVIYCAPSNLEDAIAERVVPRDKGTVLGPGTIRGLDLTAMNIGQSKARGMALRRIERIPDDCKIVGFVGRLVPHKGIKTILEAWRFLPPVVRAYSYLCICGGHGDAAMERLVSEAVANSELHVRYLGFTDEMQAWYSVMDVLAQPSWHEGWGYNVLEASYFAVPAVGTRISATVDAILDGRTGLLVPVQDPEAMATALAQLLTDEPLRQQLGEAARERTVRDFSEDKICPLMIDYYHQLLLERGLN